MQIIIAYCRKETFCYTIHKGMKKIKQFFRGLGPGFITGAADDDPSGVATYAQTGAMFGYSQLWLAFFSFPFMTVIQETCGRIGMVTGNGLSGVIRKHYSKKILYPTILLLLIANAINIGANLGAMAASARLLIDLPFALLLIVMTVITLILEVFVSYQVYAKYLKFLAFSLLAYVLVAFVVNIDWKTVFVSTLIPSFQLNKAYIFNIVAILGTTISPYLFFWEANEVVEEEIATHKLRMMGKGIPKITKKDLSHMQKDTMIGMLFSNLIMFFIITTVASTIHMQGITHIETADQAAQALRPVAGDFAAFLFALGIIGTGLLSVPVLAGSASYAVSEAFGWNAGLYRKLNQAHGFYGVITIATLIGLTVNFLSIKPFEILYYTAVLNGIIAPPLLALIMFISNDPKIMRGYQNTRRVNIIGWTTTIVMFTASILLCISFFV